MAMVYRRYEYSEYFSSLRNHSTLPLCPTFQVYARVSAVDDFLKLGICTLTSLPEPSYCDDFTPSPTQAPTVTPPPPENDQCDGSIPLTVGTSTFGSTRGATFDNVGFCETINSGPGVWYSIVGDGSLIEIDTCDTSPFDTRISVFEGSCASLECVTGNDQVGSFGCSEGGSLVQWTGEVGVTYYVLVHGVFDFAGNEDSFFHRLLLTNTDTFHRGL